MTIKGKTGAVPVEKIRHVARVLEETRESAKMYSESATDTMKDFGETGGHKAAMRNAVKLARMDPAAFMDLWRAMESYCDALGLFDQPDMLDPLPRRFPEAEESADLETDGAPTDYKQEYGSALDDNGPDALDRGYH